MIDQSETWRAMGVEEILAYRKEGKVQVAREKQVIHKQISYLYITYVQIYDIYICYIFINYKLDLRVMY